MKPKQINLLVIESNHNINWKEKFFKDSTINSIPINVVQAKYPEITCYSEVSEKSSDVFVNIKAIPELNQKEIHNYKVDFILFRSVARNLYHQDSRNLLYAFYHADIPSVNNIESIIFNLEKPVSYGLLQKVKKKILDFPLIPQTYWPNYSTMIFPPSSKDYVLKFGHANSGYGKILVRNENPQRNEMGIFQDYRGLLALTPLYCAAEPYIEYDHELRIQKIGDHIRVLRRRSTNWKGNVGNTAIIENVPKEEIKEKWKKWIIAVSEVFSIGDSEGLDICALDVLVTKDGKEYILEVNDTAIGLSNKHAMEDSGYIRDLVLVRMKEKLFPKNQKQDDKQEKGNSLYEKYRIQKLEFDLEKERERNKKLQEKIQELETQLSNKKTWFNKYF